jgi:hypothetical protein
MHLDYVIENFEFRILVLKLIIILIVAQFTPYHTLLYNLFNIFILKHYNFYLNFGYLQQTSRSHYEKFICTADFFYVAAFIMQQI